MNTNRARVLTNNVKSAQASKTRVIAGEVHMPSKIVTTPNAAEMTYELAAGDAEDKVFIIGDPYSAGAAALGGAISMPSTVNGKSSLVAPNKAMFASKGMVIGKINIETSSDKSQFSNQLKVHAVNHNGDLVTESVSFKGSKRASTYDPLVMSVNVEFVLDATRFILLTVKKGETVSLTLTPTEYIG